MYIYNNNDYRPYHYMILRLLSVLLLCISLRADPARKLKSSASEAISRIRYIYAYCIIVIIRYYIIL